MACRNPKIVVISNDYEKPGLKASPKLILPREVVFDQVAQLKEK